MNTEFKPGDLVVSMYLGNSMSTPDFKLVTDNEMRKGSIGLVLKVSVQDDGWELYKILWPGNKIYLFSAINLKKCTPPPLDKKKHKT